MEKSIFVFSSGNNKGFHVIMKPRYTNIVNPLMGHTGNVIYRTVINGMLIKVKETPTSISLHYGEGAITQASILKNYPERLQYDYARHLVQVVNHVESPSRALVLGLGGGVIPTWLHQNTKCQIDVVDIIPDLKDIAEKYFKMPSDNRIKVITEDAYHFVQDTLLTGIYDIIIVDVCDDTRIENKFISPKFYEGLKSILTPKGRVAINYFVAPQTYDDYMIGLKDAFTNVVEQYKNLEGGKNHITICNDNTI
jgi:spermidine synthase